MHPTRGFFNWSSGKDATLALHLMKQQESLPVDLLLTTISEVHQRVSMHGLHRSLLEAQAIALDMPLDIIELPQDSTMDSYNKIMGDKLTKLKAAGYTHSCFGDIFLEDLREYREKKLASVGLNSVFPIWQMDTTQLLKQFIDLGFKAMVICINASLLPKSFCGRIIDHSFINDLPEHIDPCGENGEFHTFCFDGPIFNHPVDFNKGDLVYKTYPAPKSEQQNEPKEYGYWFCDLIKQ